MKQKIFFILLFISQICFSQITVTEYYNFLKEQNQSPKDYIFELFETNDIIILGERDHRDTTQYDLILDILKDERFIKNISHIYTEVGVVNKTEWGNKVVKGNFKNQKTFEKEFVKLYRELDFNPLWDKYNMIKYLKGIYNINKELNENEKITVGFTDCAFEWDGMTKEKYSKFDREISIKDTRDSLMSDNFIQLYEKQIPINGRKKALYIQSRPHAIKLDYKYKGKVRMRSVGGFLKEKYPNTLKTVVFNWYKWIPLEWNAEIYGTEPLSIELSADGKWDAAFELTKNKSVGFSIKNTSFGKEKFDYQYYFENLKYEDIIDGIIFYKPFYEFTCTRGLPSIVDRKFAKTMIERQIISGTYNENEKYNIKDEIDDWEDFRSFNCVDYKKMLEQMNKWLTE